MKRFIDTSIWTQNKWFRKLKPESKLLWFYLISNCDSVGVWEEDIELASFIIGYSFTLDSLNDFGDRLHKFNGKKFWIKDFCNFQYGELNDANKTNRPHQSYIALLKKHSLWIVYTKTIQSLKEKEQEKDKETETKKEDLPKILTPKIPPPTYPEFNPIIKEFIDKFNEVTKKNYTVRDPQTKQKLYDCIIAGYTIDEIIDSVKKAMKDEFVKEKIKELHPGFFLETNKIEKHLQISNNQSTGMFCDPRNYLP